VDCPFNASLCWMFILQMTFSSNLKRVKMAINNPSKGRQRKEIFYSNQFQTKEHEKQFSLVMQWKVVRERKVNLKPGEINKFQVELNRRGREATQPHSVWPLSKNFMPMSLTLKHPPSWAMWGGKGCHLVPTPLMNSSAPNWLEMQSVSSHI